MSDIVQSTLPIDRASASSAKMNSHFVASTINYALGNGITMEQISEATGIRRMELIEGENRLPEDAIPKIWNLLDGSRRNQSFALHMSRATSPSILGPSINVVRYADTLRTALSSFVSFRTIFADRMHMDLIESDSIVLLRGSHPLELSDHGYTVELGTALLNRVIVEGVGHGHITGIDFAHSPNGETRFYEDEFAVPVRFEQPRNTFRFHKQSLNIPMRHHDAELFQYVKANLELLQDRWLLISDRSVLSQVYAAIKRNAANGKFSAVALASEMKMSLRKLQRQTKEFGFTVTQLLEEFREVSARELLANTDLSIGEIVTRLDYSDSRAFRRAFTRWTGNSPSDYRKRR